MSCARWPFSSSCQTGSEPPVIFVSSILISCSLCLTTGTELGHCLCQIPKPQPPLIKEFPLLQNRDNQLQRSQCADMSASTVPAVYCEWKTPSGIGVAENELPPTSISG